MSRARRSTSRFLPRPGTMWVSHRCRHVFTVPVLRPCSPSRSQPSTASLTVTCDHVLVPSPSSWTIFRSASLASVFVFELTRRVSRFPCTSNPTVTVAIHRCLPSDQCSPPSPRSRRVVIVPPDLEQEPVDVRHHRLHRHPPKVPDLHRRQLTRANQLVQPMTAQRQHRRRLLHPVEHPIRVHVHFHPQAPFCPPARLVGRGPRPPAN